MGSAYGTTRGRVHLIEMLTVVVIMAILLAIAVGFEAGARERASDATAKSNIRTAVPAIEA